MNPFINGGHGDFRLPYQNNPFFSPASPQPERSIVQFLGGAIRADGVPEVRRVARAGLAAGGHFIKVLGGGGSDGGGAGSLLGDLAGGMLGGGGGGLPGGEDQLLPGRHAELARAGPHGDGAGRELTGSVSQSLIASATG